MKIGDLIVYKPMWNINKTYKIKDIGLEEFNNYIELEDLNTFFQIRYAHKNEIQLANEEQIARYVAERINK